MKIHYEYSEFFNIDEEVFIRANNLTELNKHFLQKSGVSGRKDGSTTMEKKLHKNKEEALKLQKEEIEKMIKEETVKRKLEESQRRQEEKILRKENE